MSVNAGHSRRYIAVIVIAAVLLLGLVILAGGSLPSFSGSSTKSPTPRTPTSAPAPVQTAPAATPAGTSVAGTVGASVAHLQGHTWRFRYTVRNTGKTPIAGFQLNAPISNLFDITGRSGWDYFGAGVCRGNHPGILIYWSTSSGSATVIAPGHSAQFGFEANTSGAASALYSLSWSSATPLFGRIPAPAPSSLKATGQC